MMLLALMAFGVGMIFARRGSANVALESQLAALKAAVAALACVQAWLGNWEEKP